MSSVSKIVITGQVLRNPEKRFTENNLTISSFTMNFGTQDEEKAIRVLSYGKNAEKVAETVKKGQKVVVEGRLQTNSVKTDSGTDKKFFEINAQNVELMAQNPDDQNQDIQEQDKDFNLADEISTDDLIGEDEIPF